MLGVCHRMSSHPARPEQLDKLTGIDSFITTSIIVYDIANTRGLDGDFCHLVKPGGVLRDCHGLIFSRFCYIGGGDFGASDMVPSTSISAFRRANGFFEGENLS